MEVEIDGKNYKFSKLSDLEVQNLLYNLSKKHLDLFSIIDEDNIKSELKEQIRFAKTPKLSTIIADLQSISKENLTKEIKLKEKLDR